MDVHSQTEQTDWFLFLKECCFELGFQTSPVEPAPLGTGEVLQFIRLMKEESRKAATKIARLNFESLEAKQIMAEQRAEIAMLKDARAEIAMLMEMLKDQHNTQSVCGSLLVGNEYKVGKRV